MIEAFNATKMIIDTVQQCIEKVKSVDNSLTKIDDIIGDLAEKGELTCDDVNEYNEYWGKIENSTMKKTDSLERFKEDLQELSEFILLTLKQKKQKSKKEPKKEQKPKEESYSSSSSVEIPIKPPPKKEQKKPTLKKPTLKKQEKKKPEPKKEQEYEYYDEEESEASDFDEKEQQAKEAQQKKPEPMPAEIQQKNEAFFQDVMRLLTNFTSKLESMLREHLEIKEKEDKPEPKKEEPKKEKPKKDDATSDSGHTMSTIDTESDN